jgi:hypothetical protein
MSASVLSSCSTESVQLHNSGFCKIVSQGTPSYGVNILKQSMCPNRGVHNWLTYLDNLVIK